MSEAVQPVFTIEKIYVKDLSLEMPNAPQIFSEREAPQVEVNFHNAGRAIDNGVYEVVVTVTLTAKIQDKTMFLIEIGQAGVFQIRNVPATDIDPMLGVHCPNILFPYLREAVASVSSRAGLPPVQLQPMSFEPLYQAQLAERQKQAGTAPASTTVQ
ncbi:MAG: protein-export chaperone SecB [Burkholderiales bacterium]